MKMKARQPQPSLGQRRFPLTETSLLAPISSSWFAYLVCRLNKIYIYPIDGDLILILRILLLLMRPEKVFFTGIYLLGVAICRGFMELLNDEVSHLVDQDSVVKRSNLI